MLGLWVLFSPLWDFREGRCSPAHLQHRWAPGESQPSPVQLHQPQPTLNTPRMFRVLSDDGPFTTADSNLPFSAFAGRGEAELIQMNCEGLSPLGSDSPNRGGIASAQPGGARSQGSMGWTARSMGRLQPSGKSWDRILSSA